MTLTKTKPKRPTAEHRKRVGTHHRQSNNYLKTYWPYLPMVTVLTLGVVASSWLGSVHRDVLGYATDMSVQSLLDDTNVQRSQQNESSLTINAALNQAAQAKANDMAARDYWSHDTPDGKTPWTFITAAGYTYQTAGENLAYGFATASDTIQGWMNSPEHRANILNTSFHDVGFGIANIADYQGTGPETLVVAMYGSTAGQASLPAPVTAKTVPSEPIKAEPSPVKAETPLQPTPIATTVPAAEEPKPASKPAAQQAQRADTIEPAPVRVTQLQLVSSNLQASTAAVSILGIAAFGFVLIRHSFAWRRVFIRGERFIMHHPLLDVAAVSAASLAIVLSHTAGLIR